MLIHLSKHRGLSLTSVVETAIRDMWKGEYMYQRRMTDTEYYLHCLDLEYPPCPRCGEPLETEHLNCPPLEEDTKYMKMWSRRMGRCQEEEKRGKDGDRM